MKGEIYGKPSPPIPSISVKFHKWHFHIDFSKFPEGFT